MKDYSKLTKSIKEFIAARYPNVSCTVRQTPYQGIIHSFFFQVPNEELLEKTWEPLLNAVAFYYQANIESEFERWNFYIFYVLPVAVERALKFKIENDSISSRKIILESSPGPISPKKIQGIIEQHITNRNLDFAVFQPAANATGQGSFVKNVLLDNAIGRFSLTTKKKKVDDPTAAILKTIETYFLNEN